MSDHQRLGDELRNRASAVGGHPLTLDDIKGSATTIRRQRRAFAGGIAAAVLAVGVPVGISTLGGSESSPEPPIAIEPVETRIDLDSLEAGEPTALPYVFDGTAYAGDTTLLHYVFDGSDYVSDRTLPMAGASTVARYRDGWIVTANDDETGEKTVTFLDADGQAYDIQRAAASPVVSDDGTVFALQDLDGTLRVGPTEDGSAASVPAEGIGSPLIVSVSGSEVCTAESVCTAYVSDEGRNGGAFATSSDGVIRELPDYLGLGDVRPDGLSVGVISVDEFEPSSCSAARDSSGTTIWETCDTTPLSFSPDGVWVEAGPGYLDGFGRSSSVVLQADTGKRAATFDLGRDEAFADVVWEDADSLIGAAYSFADQEWVVVRMNLDGTVESVPGVRSGNDDFSGPVLGR